MTDSARTPVSRPWRRDPAPAVNDTGKPYRRWRDRASIFDDPDRLVRVFQWLFYVFLMFVMIRVSSGEADSEAAREIRKAGVASGDATKQIVYVITTFIFTSIWVRLRGWSLPKCLSVFQIVFFAWVLVSVSWAIDPAVSIRRTVLLLTVVTSLGMAVDILGPDRSLRVLYYVLASCTVISLISVPLFPFAVHPMTEMDQSIAGGWRGIFVHKNTAGAVTAASLILYIYYALQDRRWYRWALVLLGVAFLAGTKSKTPALVLLPTMMMGWLYFRTHTRDFGRNLFTFLVIAGFSMITFLVFAKAAAVERVFANPESFTGRAGLWQAVIGFIKDHPWLGAGYSSLWGINVDPAPIAPYINEASQEFMVHSHSGYLELLATTGIPGLVLALLAAVFFPLYQLMSERGRAQIFNSALIFTLFVFAVCENFLETQLYSRDREVWVIYLIGILGLHLRYRGRTDPAVRTDIERGVPIGTTVSERQPSV